MITDHDRSYYIGASDTKYVMGNWNTQTFRHWWDVKMGFDEDNYDNIYLRTGTMYEPKILDHIGVEDRNRQIIIGRLRVNLDGEVKDDCVVEIKTVKHGTRRMDKYNEWIVPTQYLQQLQVEMFATQYDWGSIYCYEVNDDDYEAVECGLILPIDIERLHWRTYERDDEWLNKEYLPRLWYLCRCLEREEMPCTDGWLAT